MTMRRAGETPPANPPASRGIKPPDPYGGGWQHLPYRGDPAFALRAPQGQEEPLLRIPPEITGSDQWQLGQPQPAAGTCPRSGEQDPPAGVHLGAFWGVSSDSTEQAKRTVTTTRGLNHPDPLEAILSRLGARCATGDRGQREHGPAASS